MARDGDVAVLFSGYLRDPAASFEGEARFVLAKYRAKDWGWLREANGVFAFAVVDWREDRCVLAVDRLGIRPLFFVHDECGVAFAEDLGLLSCARGKPVEFDYDTLQELMVIGFPLTDRTFLKKAERVPPGTWIELHAGRRSSRRYWSLEALPPIRRQDPHVFLDESQARLRRVLADLLARSVPHAVCLLSSGYDSRRLLLEGHAVGARFDAVTAVWPYYAGRPGTTIEPAVTSELCRRLGVPHVVVPHPAKGGLIEAHPARAVRDILLDFQVYGRHHIWAVPLVASLAPSNDMWNLDGMAGDTFFNNPFYALPRGVWGRWRADAEVLDAIAPDRDESDRMWGTLLSRSLSSRLRDALNALPEGPNRLSFFYLLGRTRGMVALLPYGMLNLRIESFCPYLDNEVLEHALTFDPVEKGERRLQAAALERHFPSFRDIPSSHSLPTDVPPSYVAPMAYSSPDLFRRFTRGELAALVRARLQPPHAPPLTAEDLAFAACHTVGIPWLGRGRRELRVRDLVHTAQIVTRFGQGDLASLLETRVKARASLERYRMSFLAQDRHVHRKAHFMRQA